jgi:hypothetical protein
MIYLNINLSKNIETSMLTAFSIIKVERKSAKIWKKYNWKSNIPNKKFNKIRSNSRKTKHTNTPKTMNNSKCLRET